MLCRTIYSYLKCFSRVVKPRTPTNGAIDDLWTTSAAVVGQVHKLVALFATVKSQKFYPCGPLHLFVELAKVLWCNFHVFSQSNNDVPAQRVCAFATLLQSSDIGAKTFRQIVVIVFFVFNLVV